jgi:hypothetical protein
MGLYLIGNGPMQTTAAFAAVTTGTAIKTMLQVKPASGVNLFIAEWGISFDGYAAAAPGKIELIESDVAATVTASAAADVMKYSDPDGPAANTALVTLGTSATGYTATAEGSTTAIRNLDGPQFLAPSTQSFFKQFPLGREPVIQAAKFARIRVTFAAAVNCYCYMIVGAR